MASNLNLNDIDLLNLAGQYLSQIPDLKLEWSLKIDGAEAKVRDKVLLLWQKQMVDQGRILELLEKIQCPHVILSRRNEIQERMVLEALSLDLKKARPDGLYFDILDEAKTSRSIEAHKWDANTGQVVSRDYRFSYFKEEQESHHALTRLLSEELRYAVENMFREIPDLHESGYFTSYQGGKIMEVYLSFYWHPTIKSILHFLPEPLRTALYPFRDLHFRQIGFDLEEPHEVTVYFSGPLRGKWPKDFNEFRSLVNKSAKLLYKEIDLFRQETL
ncbi:hypothetical protein [Roseivirga sp.]|uniref:hypothetical protein n=1 Tax=Roseivirga sp. TaxID=1964215 RepID=UPI003B51F569